MTREEAYAEGWADGVRWAERDIADHANDEDTIRWNSTQEWKRRKDPRYVTAACVAVGQARAYRDTWARWDAGALTWEMLDQAPVGR